MALWKFVESASKAQKLVSARLAGQLNHDDVVTFFKEAREAAASIGCGSGDYCLLIDADDVMVQQQDVVADFQRTLASSSVTARRVAVVTGSALLRMQGRRVLSAADRGATFATRREAIEWLLGTDSPPQT